jgi:hypothetical protein
MRMTSLCMLPLAPVARGGAEDGQLAQERSVALGCQRVTRRYRRRTARAFLCGAGRTRTCDRRIMSPLL